jgi:hypothetical protein
MSTLRKRFGYWCEPLCRICLRVNSCCCDGLGAVSIGMGGSSNASWGDWRRAAAAGATASGERASR